MSDRKSTHTTGAHPKNQQHNRRPKPAGSQPSAKSQSKSFTDSEAAEIKELRKKYVDKLVTLHELFPAWTDEDLLCTLEEAYGDLDITIDRISEGFVSQWGHVGTRKVKRDGAAPAGATKQRDDRAGKGGQTANKPGRTDKTRVRDGSNNGKARGGAGRTAPAPAGQGNQTATVPRGGQGRPTRAAQPRVPGKDLLDSNAASNQETIPSTQTPSAPAPTATATAPAPQPAGPPKMTWAKILGSKEAKKPIPPKPTAAGSTPQPSGTMPAPVELVDIAIALDEPVINGGWAAEEFAVTEDGSVLTATEKATSDWVASLSSAQPPPDQVSDIVEDILESADPKNLAGDEVEVTIVTLEPAKTEPEEPIPEETADIPAPSAEPELRTPTPEPIVIAVVPEPAAAKTTQTLSPPSAINAPPGFKRPSSQQRRLRQDAPVVMPFGGSTSEDLDVQFGSLNLGSGITFGFQPTDSTPEEEPTPAPVVAVVAAPVVAEPTRAVPEQANIHMTANQPAAPSAPVQQTPTNGYQTANPNVGPLAKDYGLYGADNKPKPHSSTGGNYYGAEPTNPNTAAAAAPYGGPPGLGGNYHSAGQKNADVTAAHPQAAATSGPVSGNLGNSFPPPGLQQPFQQAPYPGLPYYSYYYMPSNQYPNPAAAYQQSGFGGQFANKNMYPMYPGSHSAVSGAANPSANTGVANAGPTNAATAGNKAGGNGLAAAGYPYGNITPGSTGSGLHFPGNANLGGPGGAYDDLSMSNFNNTGAIPQLQNILGSNGAKGGNPMGAGGPNSLGANAGGNSSLKGSAGTNAPPGVNPNVNSAGQSTGTHPQGQQHMQGTFASPSYPTAGGMHPLSYQQQNYHTFSHQQPQQPPFIPGQQLYTAQHHYGAPQQSSYPPMSHHPPPSFNSHHGGYAHNQHPYHNQHAGNAAGAGAAGANQGATQYHGSATGASGGAGNASQYHSTSANSRTSQNYWPGQN